MVRKKVKDVVGNMINPDIDGRQNASVSYKSGVCGTNVRIYEINEIIQVCKSPTVPEIYEVEVGSAVEV